MVGRQAGCQHVALHIVNLAKCVFFSLMFIMQRVESGVSGQLNRLRSEEIFFFSLSHADKEAILTIGPSV